MRDWLVEIREKNNITRNSLANLLNIDATHVQKIEKGQRDPSVAVAIKIGKILNFDWRKFYEEIEKEINNSELG